MTGPGFDAAVEADLRQNMIDKLTTAGVVRECGG